MECTAEFRLNSCPQGAYDSNKGTKTSTQTSPVQGRIMPLWEKLKPGKSLKRSSSQVKADDWVADGLLMIIMIVQIHSAWGIRSSAKCFIHTFNFITIL